MENLLQIVSLLLDERTVLLGQLSGLTDDLQSQRDMYSLLLRRDLHGEYGQLAHIHQRYVQRVAEQNRANASLVNERDGLQRQVSTLQAHVSTLEAQVANLQAVVSTLRAELATLKKEVNKYHNDLATVRKQEALLEGKVAAGKLVI